MDTRYPSEDLFTYRISCTTLHSVTAPAYAFTIHYVGQVFRGNQKGKEIRDLKGLHRFYSKCVE